MEERTVLMVGLQQEQADSIPLPEGVTAARVATVSEAVDALTRSPPALIVTNDSIGEHDSLDFYQRMVEAAPESATPVVFMAPPGTGMHPFVYQRQVSGFQVRYLDADGEPHTHFVSEETKEKAYCVRALHPDRFGGELVELLSDDGGFPDEPTGEELEARLWELGFNQDLAAGEQTYHIQTEVVDVKPLTISTAVFSAGRAVHSQQERLKQKGQSLKQLRTRVGSIHAAVVSQVNAGAIR